MDSLLALCSNPLFMDVLLFLFGKQRKLQIVIAANLKMNVTINRNKGLSIYYVIRDEGAGVFPIYYNIT